jgi:hypothetical protein
MRIGPKMQLAQIYVADHPGCNMHDVAKYVAPYGQHCATMFGYATVHRAIKANLIKTGALANGRKGNFGLYPFKFDKN